MISSRYHYISQSIHYSSAPKWITPEERESRPIHPWPEPETAPEEIVPSQRWNNGIEDIEDIEFTEFNVLHQEVLLLHGPKQKYAYTIAQPVPTLYNDREMLVAVEAVGLNPIDWKAPDFGFGLPTLPCISGRDLAGRVVKAPKAKGRFKIGDSIMAISTDYRDSRKSAYQQYAVVSDFNACRLSHHVNKEDAAPLGVAFVAAALALGICIGMDFLAVNGGPRGPDLLRTVRSLSRDALSPDIQTECFDGISEVERPKKGDWIAIWGGSSASGCCAVQLAKMAGLKVIAVVDLARSGRRMLKHGADLLVDRIDPERAVSIIKSITEGRLRFGLDTIGKESATLLAGAMQAESEVKNNKNDRTAHLVGLTGLPKEPLNDVIYHSVPIKAFHEAPQIGDGLMMWLERLLELKLIATPDIEIADGGLEGINDALDKLRDGSVNGTRIVVPLRL